MSVKSFAFLYFCLVGLIKHFVRSSPNTFVISGSTCNSVLIISSISVEVISCVCVVLRLPLTLWRLAKVAILITKLQTKREIQTYEKVLYEIRNRHFCQTLVMCSPLFFVWFMLFIFSSRIQILQL